MNRNKIMANLQIRIDDDLRDQAQQIAQDLGMDLTTAVRVFLKQMVHNHGLPFKPELDPFYTTRNQIALQDSIQELSEGKLIKKSLKDLQAMEK